MVDRLEQVDPPAEVATAYEGVVAAYAAMAEGDLADPNPAVQEELVAAQEHMVDLFAYLSENCDLPVPGGGPVPGGTGG